MGTRSYRAMHNAIDVSKTEWGRKDLFATFLGNFLETGDIGDAFVRVVEDRLRARMVIMEANKCMPVVNDKHRVAE